MITVSNVDAIKTYIRMDQDFIDNIIPHVNMSIRGKGHYIYCCFSLKCFEHPAVAAWVKCQGGIEVSYQFVDSEKWKAVDNPSDPYSLTYAIIGMSLSQLTYQQLSILADLNCHRVIKLPSTRQIPNLEETKNPLLFIDTKTPNFLYFARNRILDEELKTLEFVAKA